ncbi:hypothetical protein [Streptomyces sp. 8L]|uniref:hypothetical protein n=1 Tax=Streptomyces sp. 8L TaxID=2877242 RepID=UPI001CD3C75A|nr:hypothetical protein [Streptomyces sp. 8L]MCA1223407.1 hypothetical protein [Streptomyces sp. 8L]
MELVQHTDGTVEHRSVGSAGPPHGQDEGVTRQRADYPCVLPGDPTWIHEAGYVQDILTSLAAAAAVAHDYGDPEKYVLPHLPFQVAADTIGRIRSDMPPARHDAVFLMALPAFQLEALWQALGVLRRARDEDGDAAEVLDLVRDYTMHCFVPPRRVDDVVTDMERILAVLSLDIPAVHTVATALLLKGERGNDFRSARDDLFAAWRAAGVGP